VGSIQVGKIQVGRVQLGRVQVGGVQGPEGGLTPARGSHSLGKAYFICKGGRHMRTRGGRPELTLHGEQVCQGTGPLSPGEWITAAPGRGHQ